MSWVPRTSLYWSNKSVFAEALWQCKNEFEQVVNSPELVHMSIDWRVTAMILLCILSISYEVFNSPLTVYSGGVTSEIATWLILPVAYACLKD